MFSMADLMEYIWGGEARESQGTSRGCTLGALAMAKVCSLAESPSCGQGSRDPLPTSTAPEWYARKQAKRRCSVAYAQDGISSEGLQPWKRTCRIKCSFTLFKKTDHNISYLRILTCSVQNNLSVSSTGNSQQIKNKQGKTLLPLLLFILWPEQ